MDRLLTAQLLDSENTAFIVVVAAVGVRAWSRYLKHFRSKREVPMHVEGLGVIRHWLLEYAAGDGRKERKKDPDRDRTEHTQLMCDDVPLPPKVW